MNQTEQKGNDVSNIDLEKSSVLQKKNSENHVDNISNKENNENIQKKEKKIRENNEMKDNKNIKNCNSNCNIIKDVIYDMNFGELLALFSIDKYNKYNNSNNIPYYQLDEDNQIEFMNKINDIIYIEKCNSKALDYTFLKTMPANRSSYIGYLKETDHWKEAKIKHIIQGLNFIMNIGLTIYIAANQYKCIEEPASDKNYWECSHFMKCKVTKQFFSPANIIRLIYYLIFYIIFYLSKGIFLWAFQRLQMKRWIIISIRIAQYILLGLIFLLDFFNKSKCVKNKNKKNVYVMVDNLELVSLIFSIIDIILNKNYFIN